MFLADSPAIADRIPAQDPAGTFSRYIGLSGYSPVTDADITMAQRPIASVADFRGGLFGTSWASSNDTLPFQSVHANLESAAGNLQIGAAVPFYLWFGLPLSVNGLDIVSVSYNGVDIPITKQANAARGRGEVQIWVSDATYMWAEIKDHPFVLTIEKDASAPNTYNRYAVVTANPNPTAADFLSANATFSGGARILIPGAGWVGGQGYLHFALPAAQDAPKVAGLPGGTNLLADFTVRSVAQAIPINGDSMRTLSSDALVFEMTDPYSLFPWIVR